MKKIEKRKIKININKHRTTIMYVIIFVMASVITVAAAANRTDKIAYVDESQLVSKSKEAIDIKNSEVPKVASKDENVTKEAIAENNSKSYSKIRIVEDIINVRKGASVEAEAIGCAMLNEEFNIISTNGEWFEIEFYGNKGFVKKEFVKTIK